MAKFFDRRKKQQPKDKGSLRQLLRTFVAFRRFGVINSGLLFYFNYATNLTFYLKIFSKLLSLIPLLSQKPLYFVKEFLVGFKGLS
jgi:hypothetical protein